MASLPTRDSSISFWHSEPSKFLLKHRTTSELPKEADIVIVGSGITGASAARFLAEDARANNLSIIMLEAREACWGATGRNGGHCQPLLYDSSPDVAAFEVSNYNTVRSFVKTHNVPCEWRTLPGCRTFWTEELADLATKEVEHLKQAAPDLAQKVILTKDPQELQQYRVNGAAAATITEEAGSLWPYKLVAFILEKLVKEGRLNLQTNTPVTAIEASENLSEAGRKGHILYTPRGTIKATRIILATNAYTSHLLPEFADLIIPERGMMTALLPPMHMPRLSTSYGFVGMGAGPANSHNDYLNQRPFFGVPNPAGTLMFGGGRSAATLSSVAKQTTPSSTKAASPTCAKRCSNISF